jgi:hypothetical protein
VVIALVALGATFLSGQMAITRVAVGAAVVLCLADWVLVQDCGFFGGRGLPASGRQKEKRRSSAASAER